MSWSWCTTWPASSSHVACRLVHLEQQPYVCCENSLQEENDEFCVAVAPATRTADCCYTDPVDVDSRRRLRSASTAEVLVPVTRRSTVGDRAFAVAGPRAWNNLPVDLRLSRTFTTFKTHFKSHLFNLSFPSVWLYHWLFLYRALEAARAAYISLYVSLLHYVTWLKALTVKWTRPSGRSGSH